ncbi:zinc finger protein 384b isoform X5 [Corythoichthys intestinalis]|uniref:zinc finger protein 384b isoform X5 n=1 Tax=Corythoichthys intestinalis TaxID=161448 RepID=UPI0025A5F42F|nr:zinc finger protein 384b isoform X5 [Corythoichthys intestinalis]
MEDNFNSSYFWSPIPPGQLENAMFLNKVKEHQEKNASFPPSSASHYQTALLTIPTPAGKTDVGGHTVGAQHLHPPHSSQNITVLPVPSTGIMTAAGLVITTPQGTLVSPTSSQSFMSAHPPTTMIVSAVHSPDKKEDGTSHVVVMPAPSKRGRKKKCMVGEGNETVILAQLSTGGQVTSLHHPTRDPYDLTNEDDEPGLKDSTKTYSNHTESKPHKCPHCTKSFANSSYLAQHLRIHTGVKPYTCSYCQKSFRQLSHLQQHNRIHTGDRPYKCSYSGCEKSFTQLSNLQSHRRQHNKDKPYKCSNCNKGYVDAASLEVHMAKHTVRHARIYSCGLCNRTYTSETYLVKHMEKHGQEQMNASDPRQAARAQPAARSQAEGSEGAATRAGHGQSGYNHPDAMPCSFDMHQYKTVSASDIQYKPVSVADISSHKDLCLTVSSSSIQVEHLNS